MSRPWAVWLALGIVAALGLAPVGNLLLESFLVDRSPSLAQYRAVFDSRAAWNAMGNSLILAGSATILSVMIGVCIAFVAARTTTPFRNVLAVIFCFPVLIPPYVLANGWFQVLGRGGLISRWFGHDASIHTSNWLFGFPGGILVLTTALMPLIVMLAAAAFRSVNPALEDAARLHYSWPGVLRRVTLPLVKPAISTAAVLTFLLALGEFAAPSFLRIPVFAVETMTQFSAFYDAGQASATAVPLAALAVAMFWLTGPAAGAGSFRWASSAARPIPLCGLEAWVAGAGCLLAFFLVGLPCLAVIREGLSTSALGAAWGQSRDAMLWSVIYAIVSATMVTALGSFLGYASARCAGRWKTRAPMAILFLFALPASVTGIGAIILWNRPGLAWLYASPAALVIAMAMQFLAIGERGIAAAIQRIPPSAEEAAWLAGAGPVLIARTILMPQLKSALIAVWAAVFVLCLRESTLPLLLSPPGKDPLTARTMTLMANGFPPMIAALNVFSIGLPLAALLVLVALYWRPVSR